MTAGKEPPSAEVWEVVVARLYNTANRGDGAEETSIVQGTEAEARRVYADRTAEAADRGYDYVTLRCDGKDVELWPQATGWTS
ncbi:hypothetical protein [Mycolicibacterium pyrenivorans]|uniref:hypothetical protein n=1 Tax=Mycolicibacterium pyrenivorans TaxID=187102 RepID=UPI0021F366E9|nr:hypothetical protein [Mycolicibacterium pyrenivorans]MCV7151669.1 hypothetical protein [Mycolicibacterium pyrenivorans]